MASASRTDGRDLDERPASRPDRIAAIPLLGRPASKRLDGRLVVRDRHRELVTTPAPLDAVQLRALAHARVEVGEMPRSAATATKVRPDHPWRRVRPGAYLHARIKAELDGATGSREQLADKITEL